MEISSNQNPYEFYSCDLGHSLLWCGNNLNSTNKCKTCKKNYSDNKQSVIRWKCNTCNHHYCQACIKILKCRRCPVNHEYKKTNVKKYSYFVCDICLNHVENSKSVWMDDICNLGFCEECIGDSENLDDFVYTYED